LDARNKKNIHWLLRINIISDELKGGDPPVSEKLNIPYKKHKEKVLVIGSGPAGFFCALTLLKAGFDVTILERGSEVDKREKAVINFEKSGIFNTSNNYCFGEGGAGTFSDGKLTSRSKYISCERNFIIENYIKAGAPDEIKYLAHPHLGTDNLKKIVVNLRNQFINDGGKIFFDTKVEDIEIIDNVATRIFTTKGIIDFDAIFIASGNSAYDTYKILINRGIMFRTKNFAVGTRMEHIQEIINMAQWGKKIIKGIKAAEYRLTSEGDGKHHVYSFCMCPGGIVVPAMAFEYTGIVNGMSYYNRDGIYANAACVASVHPDELAGYAVSAYDALNILENFERKFYAFSNSYKAPACTIKEFINKRLINETFTSSYPLSTIKAPLWNLLPDVIVDAITKGLIEFSKKIKGFENGILLGFESKTSSPIQVVRDEKGLCSGFENIYVVGEGSGYAGGIISSASDGIKIAMRFIYSKY